MGNRKKESNVERAITAAKWGAMLYEQTCKVLNEEKGDPLFAGKHPELVAMCMQAGSTQVLVRALDELRQAVDGLEQPRLKTAD